MIGGVVSQGGGSEPLRVIMFYTPRQNRRRMPANKKPSSVNIYVRPRQTPVSHYLLYYQGNNYKRLNRDIINSI